VNSLPQMTGKSCCKIRHLHLERGIRSKGHRSSLQKPMEAYHQIICLL
jgi:hypothetical protein